MKQIKFSSSLFLLAFFIFSLYPVMNSFAQSEIWGASHGGGRFNAGAIYKTDANGENPTIEHSFEPSGSSPLYTQLTEAPNGKFYGMTYSDGTDGGIIRGMVFSFEPTTLTYHLIHEFSYLYSLSFYDGSSPTGSLLLASDGLLYGMTNKGGWSGGGVLFRIDPSTNEFSSRYEFNENSGYYPFGSLIEASNGKLYGMTSAGGLYGKGVIFEYDIGNWSPLKIFDFDGLNSGSYPRGDLMEASNGMLYGMTWSGGAFDSGVLFEFNPQTSVFTKKMDFSSLNTNGYSPAGSLIQASNGRFYGTTTAGGLYGKGVLFEYRPITSSYVVRFDFDSISGSYPYGNPVEANNGAIYGMTSAGGDYDMGVIYSYVLGEYMAQSIMSFNGQEKGAHPKGSMIVGSDGVLYGLTTGGGEGDGVIFQYNVESSVFSKLMNFKGEENLFGIHPYGRLLFDQNGNFYGRNRTCFFEFDPVSDSMYKRLDFENNNYQIDRMDDVLLTDDGKALFITTDNPPGNMYGSGALFSLNINSGIIDSLYGWSDEDYEGNPTSIIKGSNGLIYGTTRWGGYGYGSVFSYDLNTSSYTDIASFDGSNGVNPYTLIQSSDGMLYGFSQPHQYDIIGAFFKIDPETLVFTKIMDYIWCIGSLITAPNGYLYWVHGGALMEYNPYSSLLFERYSGFANSPLLPMADGRIFGTTSGGSYEEGSLFEYHPASFQLINKMDFNDSINWPSSLVELNASSPISVDFQLKVYLEGSYISSGMTPTDGLVLPLSQPFGQPPWNYFGQSTVSSIPNNVVDWVLVELRSAANPAQATSLSTIKCKAGFLMTNGLIKDLDGISDLTFDLSDAQEVYVVVYQRNHLPILSSVSLQVDTSAWLTYDFTTSGSQAFGINAEKELDPGIYGMYGGDANTDFVIDSIDHVEAWSNEVGQWGYIASDFNGDGQADNKDKDDVMLLNQSEVSQVPRVDDCGFILIDQRENWDRYSTVKIGNQCWMAANLDIGVHIDDSLNQTDNNTIERYYHYLPGSLYQWDEMMQYDTTEGVQGICPDGWHIPSDAEWCMLEQSIDSTVDCSTSGWRGTDVGIKMKETGGFNAIMNGFRQPFAPFFANQDTLASFWSSTQHDATAWHRQLDVAQAGIYRGTDLTKNYGLSVRCVKN